MQTRIFLGLAAAMLFSGCSGGSSSSPISHSSGGSQTTQSVAAITGANSLGTPVKDISDNNSEISGGIQTAAITRHPLSASGTCTNGAEFFAPDKNHDANSTEFIVFYDSACTEPARDTVRLYTITSSSSDTINATTQFFALGNTTPIATRQATRTNINATLDQYGYPEAAEGFDHTDTGYLSISGSKTINSDGEIVLEPAQSGTNTFCSDSAGFNATGFSTLGLTFGWQGVAPTGTRTVNSDGSITWSTTHTGSAVKGAIGSLSIAIGTQNTACPISTPMFTIAGGTVYGNYSIPLVATFKGGVLTDLTITGATLANGNTLNVTTNTSDSPGNSSFITGSIANGTTTIATFSVDAFGDGVLTVSSSGAQFLITDWHVVNS